MKHKTVILYRLEDSLSVNTIESDALEGMLSIPGVSEVNILSSTPTQVELSYCYTLPDKFQQTNEHLARFGLYKLFS